ncbi:MAG: rhaA [Verrucomicrobiales bacterium]|nr:rhaA [Verrucomicrobiales bacterium]
MATKNEAIERAFSLASERYAEQGVNVASALKTLASIPISLHCWQGDDVGGFETIRGALGGGLAVTGNYPGKARSAEELRADLDKVLSLLPGRHRLNLHASYGEFAGQPVDRDQIEPRHFQGWIDWAKERRMGIDFNPTYFSHPKACDGFTLAHSNKKIRRFWIDHGIRCREIGAEIGKQLETPCVTNFWIPDGYKDTPADRKSPRERLAESLDEIFAKLLPGKHILDSVEPKLFGLGSETYVVGSYDFYFGYAVSRQKMLCLDAGHFHPTENVADKISSVLEFVPEILLHVSRGVRWDSDHVVTLTDELEAIAQELVRGRFLKRVHIGLDYFDASINRVAAWVLGARALLKALLLALLEPSERLRQLESQNDLTARLVLLEETKTLPFGPIWDYYCQQQNCPVEGKWLEQVRCHETAVLSKRI